MRSGFVKWYSETKGYGFITPHDGGDDVFVHHTGIKGAGAGKRTLADKQEVEFEVEQGPKGLKAIDVQSPKLTRSG